jgi:hypothetical protein
MDYRIVSNFQEIGTRDSLKAAKEYALEESNRYEDCVLIESGGSFTHLAKYGQLYKLQRIAK